MPVSNESELRDIIENLEDGYESFKFQFERKMKEQRTQFLEDLKHLYFESDGSFNTKSAIAMFAEVKEKWEKR